MTVDIIKLKDLLKAHYKSQGKEVIFGMMYDNDQDPQINVSIVPFPEMGKHMITFVRYIENS